MTTFECNSYTEALIPAVESAKAEVPGWTMAKLAASCQMQPSYVTNVLKGRCDFNSDQLYRVAEALSFSAVEIEFLLLLLELKRTNYEKRRKQLSQTIAKIRASHLRAEKHITAKAVELSAEQLEQYYLNPYIQLVHIYLGSLRGSANAESLAKKFLISEAQMQAVLRVLFELKYIRKKGSGFEVLVEGQHLPRESHILRPHHMMMRMKSLDQMQRLAPEQNYSFSATISTSPEVRTKIQSEFLKFLKAAEKLVRNNDSDKLYQINFDLFPWEID